MSVYEPRPRLARSGGAAVLASAVAVLALGGCEPPRVSAEPSMHTLSSEASCRPDPELQRTLSFERSPGGVPEVDGAWVREHHCDVRLVDVRDEDELAGPLGFLPWAEHVPLDRLADASERWSPEEPIVLVCRSGRRSARAVRMLEDLGFTRAASMTGGMLVWHDRSYHDPRYVVERRDVEHHAPRPRPAPLAHDQDLTREAIAAHLGDPRGIRWVKVAALLMQGTQSCVDGRDPRPVVGTPGGDSGELLLALAAAEHVRGSPIDPDDVGPILDAYLDAFGRFYVHTDAHALRELGAHLRDDPRFAPHLARTDEDAVERLVRRPPRIVEAALLDELADPAHVGCGHLRLILSHPEEYGVRTELAQALVRAVFVRLWRGDAIDFVVLEGDHHEGAVVNVVLDEVLHPFTRIPTVAPRMGDRELFVNHPQVSAWLREQNASFLFGVDPWLRDHPDRQREFLETLESMGNAQLGATLHHLAARLPVFEAHVSEHQIRVVGPLERPRGAR